MWPLISLRTYCNISKETETRYRRKFFTRCVILRTNRLRAYSFRCLYYFYDFCKINTLAWNQKQGIFSKEYFFVWTDGYTIRNFCNFYYLFKSWNMYVFSILYITRCELIPCNKIIHSPPFTTQIFIVTPHSVQHVSTLIKATNRC